MAGRNALVAMLGRHLVDAGARLPRSNRPTEVVAELRAFPIELGVCYFRVGQHAWQLPHGIHRV
jgi:hypothetical protein